MNMQQDSAHWTEQVVAERRPRHIPFLLYGVLLFCFGYRRSICSACCWSFRAICWGCSAARSGCRVARLVQRRADRARSGARAVRPAGVLLIAKKPDVPVRFRAGRQRGASPSR